MTDTEFLIIEDDPRIDKILIVARNTNFKAAAKILDMCREENKNDFYRMYKRVII